MALQLPADDREIRKCSMAKIIDSLDDADKETLQVWLSNNVNTYQIFLALKADGHRIGKQTIYEHRNKVCICGTK